MKGGFNMKKLISLILSVVLVLSTCALSAGAVSGAKIEVPKGKAEAIAEEFFTALTGVSEDAEIEISNGFVKMLSGEKSAQALSKTLSSYAFLNAADLSDSVLESLLADTDCTVKVRDDGKAELYIGINIEEHPELYTVSTFRKYVKSVVDNSRAYYAERGYDPETTKTELTFDSYERFAGELALHMIVYNVFSPLQKIFSSSTVDTLVNKAVYAEMNVSESRAPSWFMVLIGMFFLNVATRIAIF